jgi:hypothetical protein
VAKVRDKQSGQVLDVADDEVGEYLLRGYQVPKGTRVPVMVQGQMKSLPMEDVQNGGLSELGGDVATAAMVAEHRKQQEFGEGVGAVRGGAEAFARGATLGLSDVAATGLGADAEGMQERKGRLGTLGTALELAGNVAPLLASGGTSLAARGLGVLGAPVRAVAGAAGMAEAGLAAKLGTGAASRLMSAGAGAALEGAAFGAGHAASEAALEDTPLTGESLLAHAGTGAIVGGAAGALFRGAGLALAGRAEAAAERGAWRQAAESELVPAGAAVGASGGARAAVGAVDDAGRAAAARERSVFGPQGVADDAGRAATEQEAAKAAQQPGLRAFFKDLVEDQRSRVIKAFEPGALDDLATEFAFTSGRPMAKHLKDARRFNGADYAQKIGRDMLEELPKRAGKEYQYLSQEELYTAAKAAREDFGAQMGAAVRQADEAAQAAKRHDLLPDTDAIYATIQRDVLGPLEGKEAGASAQRIAAELRADIDPYFEARAGRVTTFEDLKGFLNKFQKLSENKLKAQTESGAAFKDARRAMEGEIEQRIELASTELGLGGGYREAKSKFASMKAAEKMTEDAITRDQKNRLFSLSDYLTGTSVMAGATALGAGPGALLLGLALGGLNKIARERGSAIAAGMLSRHGRTQEMAGVQETVAKTTRKAVDAFFAGSAAPKTASASTSKAASGVPLADKFAESVKRVRQTTPETVAQRTTDAIGPDGSRTAPMSTAAAVAASVRAYEFLKSKIPDPETLPSHYTSKTADRDRVPDSQKAKFVRYVDAVESPLGVIEDFGNGSVTRESAEALRIVYPALFGKVSQHITETLVDREKPPSYQHLQKLSVLLDKPMHPMQEPRFIGSVQTMYAQQSASKSPNVAPSQQAAPKSNEKPTQAQRLAAGE